MPFWLKNADEMMCNEDRITVEQFLIKEKKQLDIDLNLAVFDLFNISGHSEISVLDLVEMCSSLPKDCPLGAEVHHLLEIYVNKSLIRRGQTRKDSFSLNYHTFMKLNPKSCLKTDLENILCLQFRCRRNFFFEDLEMLPEIDVRELGYMKSVPDER